ncbi:hypothetical protein PHMEG_00014041 [Phytophthora megakarya]|uniref:Uncharacterized protein n=1 Tax=Phytophthora megakarya TaxID=4795 RepID=A0A225W4X5_9STRA|nr:hypothetical protein PHMEG_00014041 [Phytophthora megakarya]
MNLAMESCRWKSCEPTYKGSSGEWAIFDFPGRHGRYKVLM